MGLEVSVGARSVAPGDSEALEHYRGSLDRLSAVLAEQGITWREPTTEVPPLRAHAGGFPYSYLPYLRRALALLGLDKPVTPTGRAGVTARDDSMIQTEMSLLSSHLLCHADNAGYYVPADFGEPLFLSGKISGGGIVGSCQGLMGELRRLAPALGIALTDNGELTDDEATRVVKLPDESDFAIESVVWLTLFEASRVSIASGHAVIFH
jgi:hypothetical protein